MPGPHPRIEGAPSEYPLNEGLHRRQVLALGSAAVATCCLGASGPALAANPAPAAERPQKGDWLVVADSGEHEGKVIKLDMLSVGGAMMNAWPVDSETKITRSKSRFNKVIVVRVEPDKLDKTSLDKSVEGVIVIAFSSVCTHQACAVTGWIPEDAMLACPCHG
jgi:Rieske Fe-S protein